MIFIEEIDLNLRKLGRGGRESDFTYTRVVTSRLAASQVNANKFMFAYSRRNSDLMQCATARVLSTSDNQLMESDTLERQKLQNDVNYLSLTA